MLNGKEKSIFLLKKGDTILGYKKGLIKKNKVTGKFSMLVKQRYILRTSKKKIVCSANHKVLIARKNGYSGYKKAKDLKVGDILFQENGE